MPSVTAVVDAMLVMERGRGFRLTPYAGGFRLEGLVEGDSGWYRHWPLEPEAGWIGTTDENVVDQLWVRGCVPGQVSRPDRVRELEADLDLTMAWPAEWTARVDESGETTRYEARCSDAEPAAWISVPGASAVLGLGPDRGLLRIVAEAEPITRSREPLRLRAGEYRATLNQGFLHVERRSWIEPDRGDSPESADGTATLGRTSDGSLLSLTVAGAEPGEPVDLPDAASADELSLWQSWPAGIRATWWREGERTRAIVRFGGEPPEGWARLGTGDVWAGSSADGELRALLFGDVESPSAEGSPRFELYGLAGAVGEATGSGETFGVLSRLVIAFGDRDGGGPSVAVASSLDDRHAARWEALEHLGLGDEPGAPDGFAWTPAEIPVDGAPAPFELVRIGHRWAAVGRIGRTTLWLAGEGYELADVALERISDVTPYVPRRASRSAPMAALDGLMDALHRNAGAPSIGEAFTARVVEPWGGRGRHEQLLSAHTMLRPIIGHGRVGGPVTRADGSVAAILSLQHALPSDGSVTTASMTVVLRGDGFRPEPVPDCAAIRRGEPHPVEFRMVEEDGEWRVDTDLLRILIDRLGPLEDLVRPLSQQVE